MKSLVQEERLTALIKSSLNLMCKTSLHYDSEVEIKGLLGITLDKKNVFLVDVKEIITLGDSNDQSDLEAEQDVGDDEQDDSSNVLPSTAKRNYTSAKNSRTLKRNRRIVKDQEVGGVEGEPKQKKRHGKGYSANGDNSGGQQENNVDLDYCVVKVEKQENDDTDLNTSDILPVSNEVVDASQMAGDCADDYDNGGNEDSDNEVGESTIEKTPFDSKKVNTTTTPWIEPLEIVRNIKGVDEVDEQVKSEIEARVKGKTDLDCRHQRRKRIAISHARKDEDSSTEEKLPPVKISELKLDDSSTVYKCDSCDYTNPKLYSVKQHFKRRHYPRRFGCPFLGCDIRFNFESDLRGHLKCVHGTPHKCQLCPDGFKSKIMLEKHMVKKHGKAQDLPFKCTFEGCAKQYYEMRQLETHLNAHTNTKPYKCGKCKKGFFSLKSRATHMVRCEFSKSYQCSVCQKIFRTSIDLKVHFSAMHTSDIYVCEFCNKVFRYRNRWYVHTKTCDAEKVGTVVKDITEQEEK